MGIMKKLVTAGIAKKLYDEARKPQNQARIKGAAESFRNRGSKRPDTSA